VVDSLKALDPEWPIREADINEIALEAVYRFRYFVLAISKDGKPLAGAAKTAFVKKCKKDSCEPKAVSSDGKFMKKCQNDA
jgi:hypothetical protein